MTVKLNRSTSPTFNTCVPKFREMVTGIVLGTRPEIIKMAPVIREYKRRGHPFFVLHTGQHYSYEMDRAFFEDLELDDPEHNLNVGSGSHAEQTGRIMTGVEKVITEGCDLVLVEGDTNTVLAGALAAAKLNIPVAGLRSFDRTMPEEINRVVADHVSEILFAPTETSKRNLLDEGIPEDRIHVTGNTVVDAVRQNLEIAQRRRDPLKELGLEPREYFLVTAHRAENVDNRGRLESILRGLSMVAERYDQPMVYPVHPRTQKMIKEFRLTTHNLKTIQPQGYLDFLALEQGARLILTDSGGVQEEACVLGVPCVTLRDNTERPETIEVGANTLTGVEPTKILKGVEDMLSVEGGWTNPFGDGRSAERILSVIRNRA
jgi:UDP-N-acetylglucosamine 2-epimerase (non-hydrolysing)